MATEAAFIQAQGNLAVCQEIFLNQADGAGVAGTYSGSVSIPANAHIENIIVMAEALWNSGTSAALNIGDTGTAPAPVNVAVAANTAGFFASVDCKATDLLVGETLDFANAGGKAGVYIANSQVLNRYSTSSRVITASILTVGATTTGKTRIIVKYIPTTAVSRVVGTFVAT